MAWPGHPPVTRSAEPIAAARPAPRRDLRILCFVDDLAVAELHNTHRVCQSLLVGDCVFRDPEIPVSEHPLDLEAGRLAGMMAAQSLQIASAQDPLTGLRIVADGVVGVDFVFRVQIAGRGSRPVLVQRSANLSLLHQAPSSMM